MKYFNLQSINDSILIIIRSNLTQEDIVGTAGTELSRFYFPSGVFTIRPEQIQSGTGKRPDLTIDRYRGNYDFSMPFQPHCFIEFKSLLNINIPAILDKLHGTILVTLDNMGNKTGNFSTFMIAMKGVKIAFYTYHNFSSLLDDYGIPNYKGFIPLNYRIPRHMFMDINKDFTLADYLYSRYNNNVFFETDSAVLSQLGALGIDKFPHTHIFDLLDANHREHIYLMFKYIAENSANIIAQ